MIDSNIKTFRLSRSNKLKGGLVLILISGILIGAAIADNNLRFLLFGIPLVVGIPSIFLFSTKLEISDNGMKYSDGVFTVTSNWEEIEKIMNKGVLTRLPALTYKKFATPLVWRIGLSMEPKFSRTINLRQFDRNWLKGEIGKEVSKYIPELTADL